jgi:predicted Zn-dependent protease
MIESSKFDSATTYLDQAVLLDSTNSEAYYLLGKVKARSKDYNLASWYLYKAEKAGYSLDSIINIKLDYLDDRSKQDLYEEMSQKGVRNFELFEAKVRALEHEYRDREALELIMQEKSKYEDKDAVLFLQAGMEYELKDYVGSETHLDQLIKKGALNKRHKAICFGYKASIAYSKGNKSLTLQFLNEAIKIFPMKNYLRFRGSIYIEMENKKAACEDFREAYEMGSVEAIEELAKYCQNEQTK